MTHRGHNSQLHNLAGQQPQRPVGIASGWRSESRYDDAGLLIARQHLRHGRLRSFHPMEGLFKTPFDQPPTDPLDRSRPTRECLGDPRVGPIRPVGVGLQKHLSPPNFLARPLELLDNTAKLLALRIGQSHHVPLLHGASPCVSQNPRFTRIRQSEVLPVTQHQCSPRMWG